MNIKFLTMGISLIIIMICFSGCNEQQNDVVENNEQKHDIVQGFGTIVYNDSEGGFYGIVADQPFLNYSTSNLIPVELLPDFKKDGLKVWFEVQFRPDLTNNTWGLMVDILGIEKVE